MIKRYGLDFIFLVTPETSEDRVRKLDELSSGFLYAVSSSSTTGSSNANNDLKGYLGRLRSLGLKNPVLVGFGIRDREGFEMASSLASGAIIGSAFIKAISQPGDLDALTKEFLQSVLG